MYLLKPVAHFYNTLDQQMISCQQPMMLNSAIAFEKLVKNPKTGNLKFFPSGWTEWAAFLPIYLHVEIRRFKWIDFICLVGSKAKGENVEITWDDPEELDKYIHKLQKAAERLTTENRKLRKCHLTVCEKVQTLMGVDLLRQQQKWKDGLMEIRHLMANLVQQVLYNY